MVDDHDIVPANTVALERDTAPVDPVVAVLMQRPNVTPDEVRDMLAAQREYRADVARQAFDDSFAALSVDLPRVIGKDRGVSYGRGEAYRYATLANILSQVKPVLASYGFTIRWRTENDGNAIRVTCELRHRDGHLESCYLAAPPDSKGSKSAVQAIGSTVSYLERYTLCATLGITTGDTPDADDAPPVDPDGIDPQRTAKAITWLRRREIDVADAEAYLNKPPATWTHSDLDDLKAWGEKQ
jgi:hypothetical protein